MNLVQKLVIAEGYNVDGAGDTSSLKENGMITRSKSASIKSKAKKGEIKANRAQLLRNAQMEKVSFYLTKKNIRSSFDNQK